MNVYYVGLRIHVVLPFCTKPTRFAENRQNDSFFSSRSSDWIPRSLFFRELRGEGEEGSFSLSPPVTLSALPSFYLSSPLPQTSSASSVPPHKKALPMSQKKSCSGKLSRPSLSSFSSISVRLLLHLQTL